MARITLEEQVEYPLLPEDSILDLKIMEVETKEVDSQRGKWTKCEITFKILGVQHTGDGSPTEAYNNLLGEKIWGSVPFRFTDSSENKLRQWAEAILGMDLGIGFELDTDMFKERRCRGITGQYNKKAINPATQQPFKQHDIQSLLRATGPEPTQQPVQQQAAGWGAPAQAPAQDPWGAPPSPQAGWGAPPQQPVQQPLPTTVPPQQIPQTPPAPTPAADPWGDGWGDEPAF